MKNKGGEKKDVKEKGDQNKAIRKENIMNVNKEVKGANNIRMKSTKVLTLSSVCKQNYCNC